MKFAVTGETSSESFQVFVAALGDALAARGFDRAGADPAADLVVNVIGESGPKPFRRRARGTFVAAIHELPEVPADILKTNYPLLVRALANIVLVFVPGHGAWFTTMERGHYGVEGRDTARLAGGVADRLIPLATSKLVIDNEFREDLEPELWDGDEISEELKQAGARLGDLDLLPAPFPIEELLDERDLRHVKRLYGIGGLSYGNLSAREDEHRFWMSASGVDKSNLQTIGRDILLVSDYDAAGNTIVLSVPPVIEPRRVSVDAIEHWMIYRQHPGVGAILHVHAWMQGIAATDVNYPCGTEELALSVSELLAQEPDPDHAVIGLRNHGITATGESLNEILDRIEPRVLRQIPMT